MFCCFSVDSAVANITNHPWVKFLVLSRLSVALVIVLAPAGVARGVNGEEQFDSFIIEQHNGISKQLAGYNKYMMMNAKEFDTWRAEEARRFEEFKKGVENRWGEYLESTRKCFVSYSDDYSVLQLIDFERGIVKVEVLSRSDEHPDSLEERLAGAVEELVGLRGSETEEQKESGPLLEDQIDSGELENISQKAVSDTTVSNQKKLSVTFSMVPDHIRRRAFRYYPLVRKYCDKYNLSVSHVMATIHTESLFNPLARSSFNALGLMQIVPETGGRDAYSYVYGLDAVPSPQVLYNPCKNIELGCAYIYLLKNRHFGAVSDQFSNLYCSIAGFNTGPGNVAFAFTGRKELSSAIKVINTMKNPQMVYGRLLNYLPFYETRIYLKNVLDAMQIYK